MGGDVLNFLDPQRLALGPETKERTGTLHHWRLVRDDDNIAWLLMDCEGASVNTLSEPVLEELDQLLTEIERDPPRGLVLRSAKHSGFCAGADIGMFRGLNNVAEAHQRLQRGHAIVDRLDELPFTTVAVVHGTCLGGGLELALACNYRIAVEGAKLGFPEVLLGLHPGLGGTFRSTSLMNPVQAMTLMLTGKSLPAAMAKRRGLVDAVVPERHVQRAVADAAMEKLPRHARPRYSALLEFKAARALVARKMRGETEKRVSRDHYPAPFDLIEVWEKHGGDRNAMQRAEIASFAGLVTSVKGQNLIRVFFLREALSRSGKQGVSGINHVHVVGAGTMGGDIAAWCAYSGLRVTLSDRDSGMIAGAVKRAAQLCRRKHKSRAETRDILDRFIPDTAGAGVAHADLVIEAVPEKLEIKREVYSGLAQRMRADAILATNTSSIPLEDLRDFVPNPAQFVGLHFFNPVAQMELVEVVAHDRLSEEATARANAFVGDLGKLPAAVSSAPGFLVNRVLTPYLMEAMLLLDEGVKAETIDRAAESFGMPMGPVELADQVGLDICVDVGDMLREKLGTPVPEMPGWVRDKVKKGETGRKSGQGFYSWRDGKPEKQRADEPQGDLADRLVLPFLNACMACLREQVVASQEELDGAIIFGTGFAPFTGGPMHYARSRGIDGILDSMAKLAAVHGERFEADAGWRNLNRGE